MPADAAEIVRLAGSLTKRQCNALANGQWNVHHFATVFVEEGLAVREPPYFVRLNDLGLALREHLRARADQHDHEVG